MVLLYQNVLVNEIDRRLEIFRFQGVYLYDKGENDELFMYLGYPQPIYKYILARSLEKVKKIITKFFSS